MSEAQLELNDKQREEVRMMLEKYSGKKQQQQQQTKVAAEDIQKLDPDPLESANPGETVTWEELTPKTRRYAFVRETRAIFAPLIFDKISISKEELVEFVKDTGMDITSQNEALTVCSITQADPVRVFQIQTLPIGEGMLRIENIRYIV